MSKDNLPKESAELENIINDFGLHGKVISINPVNNKNYENKISNDNKSGHYIANFTYGGHNHKVHVSPNGHSFKEYKRKSQKLLKHLDHISQ
jgi:hypothetical protein